MSRTFIEASKIEWIQRNTLDKELSDDKLKLGCLQRIARSVENMEKPYLKLLNDLKTQTQRANDYWNRYEFQKRRSAALRGVVTRMKNAKN
jgi:hypothetical protein